MNNVTLSSLSCDSYRSALLGSSLPPGEIQEARHTARVRFYRIGQTERALAPR